MGVTSGQGGDHMSTKKAKRIASIINTFTFLERNFSLTSKLKLLVKSRWTRHAKEDVMAVVRELEKYNIMDIETARDQLPVAWIGGEDKLPRVWKSYFLRWFNIEEGVDIHQIKLLTKYIMLEMKRREMPCSVVAGGVGHSVVNPTCDRPGCDKIRVNTILMCNWCTHIQCCCETCQDADYMSGT